MTAAIARAEPLRQLARIDYTSEQIRTIKQTLCKDLTDAQLGLFIEVCKSSGLDPFRKQIYAVVRKSRTGGEARVTFQTGIDGFRTIANRSGLYEGQEGPYWCGPDGKWVDVWLDATPPRAAKVGVYRHGFRAPSWATARFEAYRDFNNELWNKMPEVMLAKCAEALAIRKAFPEDSSGLVSEEEMTQAETVVTSDGSVVEGTPAVTVASKLRAALVSAKSVDELKSAWGGVTVATRSKWITKEESDEMVALKDARLAELGGVPPAANGNGAPSTAQAPPNGTAPTKPTEATPPVTTAQPQPTTAPQAPVETSKAPVATQTSASVPAATQAPAGPVQAQATAPGPARTTQHRRSNASDKVGEFPGDPVQPALPTQPLPSCHLCRRPVGSGGLPMRDDRGNIVLRHAGCAPAPPPVAEHDGREPPDDFGSRMPGED